MIYLSSKTISRRHLATVETCPELETASAIKSANLSEGSQLLQKAGVTPDCLTGSEIGELHSTIGNRAVQRMLDAERGQPDRTVQYRSKVSDFNNLNSSPENRTGLPDQLKTGLECLSGFDLAPVRVHYNSNKPYQIGALAYTRGTDIFVAPGQEKHLPHEGWHVVQQMQGRVNPNFQLKGEGANDDKMLELEAGEMGHQAERPDCCDAPKSADSFVSAPNCFSGVIQRILIKIEGSKDQADFMAAEGSLIGYLGETPVPLNAFNQVDLIGTDKIFIWGHMDSRQIGALTYDQLAEQLIAKGYRGHNEIWLIGCNDEPDHKEAPRRLWHALYNQLSDIAEGDQPEMPGIYATVGRLFTGKPELPPDKRWYVATKQLPEDLTETNYLSELSLADKKYKSRKTRFRQEAQEFVETLLERFVKKRVGELDTVSMVGLAIDSARELAKESRDKQSEGIPGYTSAYAEMTVKWAKMLVEEFAAQMEGEINPELKQAMSEKIYEEMLCYYEVRKRYDEAYDAAIENKNKAIHLLPILYDEHQETTAEFPSIFRWDNMRGKWEFNPDAWIVYDGKDS